jgi:hypothetical protein
LGRFRRGDDPYLPVASQFYGRKITADDKAERGTGKQLELSCGFGCGPLKFQTTAAKGIYGPPVHMDNATAKHAVDTYRQTHKAVVRLWGEADDMMLTLAHKLHRKWRIFTIDGGRIYHPNGTWLDYSNLSWQNGEWRLYGRRGSWSKMYGAKLVENVVQWLSRIITAEAMVEFDRAGYPIVGMAHDDVWLLVPDEGSPNLLSRHKNGIIHFMSKTPDWAPGLPLAADCKIGKTYGG